MGRFIEGGERDQLSLLPASLEDYVGQDNPVRFVDDFIDEVDLGAIGFTPGSDGSAAVPPFEAAQALSARLPQPRAIESAPRARDETQCRRDVADGPPRS